MPATTIRALAPDPTPGPPSGFVRRTFVEHVTEEECRRLFERCDALAFDEPAEAVLAGIAASRLVERVGAPAERSLTLKARSFAHLGTAYLAHGDAEAAEAAFLAAAALGRGAQLVETADLYRRWAYLDLEQRRFEDASSRLDRARRIVSGLGKEQLESYLLAASGRTHVAAGRYASAERDLTLAIERIPRGSAVDYGELYGAVAGLATSFAAGGGSVQDLVALEGHLEVLRQLAARHFADGSIALWKLRWLAANVGVAAGLDSAAEATLLACRSHFQSCDRPLETALVSLDLTELYLLQGRASDVAGVAADLFPLLGRSRARQATFAALKRFYRCALTGRLTPEVLDAVRRAMRSARLERSAPSQTWRG